MVLFSKPRVTLYVGAGTLEHENMHEMVVKSFKDANMSVTLERRKHGSWVELEFDGGTDVI